MEDQKEKESVDTMDSTDNATDAKEAEKTEETAMAESDTDAKTEDSADPAGETAVIPDLEAADKKGPGFLSKLDDALRCFSFNWVILWLVASLGVYIGHLSLMDYMMKLAGALDPMVDPASEIPHFFTVMQFGLLFVQVILVVLPFIFLSIQSGIVGGIKLSTRKDRLAPRPFACYLIAVAVGLVHSFVAFVLAVLLYVLNLGFLNMSMEQIDSFAAFAKDFAEFWSILILPLFVPLLAASLLTALFAAWRITAAVTAKKAGKAVRPYLASTAAMLIFALSFTILVYPATHVWHERRLTAEQNMEFDDDMMFDFDEDDFMFDEDMMGEIDLGDFDLGDLDLEGLDFDGEPIYMDDLLGDEDFGEVTIDHGDGE